jgi:hypothetical protein
MEKEVVSIAVQAEIKGVLESLAGTGEITRIETPAQFENANKMLQMVKEKKKYVRELYENESAPHKTALDGIRDYFRKFIGFDAKNPDGQLDRIEAKLKAPMIIYHQEEEKRRIEDQRRRDEETRRIREAAEAEARKKREAEEKARREAEEKRRQAQAAKNEEERKRLEAEARKSEKAADRSAEAAERALEVQSNAVPEVVQSMAKVKGFSVAKTYRAEIDDPEAFMMWCLQNGKLHYLIIDTKILNSIVRAEGLNFKAHGVRVVEDSIARSRAA